MHLHLNAADVRDMVSRLFVDLGAETEDAVDLQENIRIDRGRCVARCYRVTEMFAMWLIDCGVVQPKPPKKNDHEKEHLAPNKMGPAE